MIDEEIGPFALIWTDDTGSCRCVPEDFERVRDAVRQYVATRRDVEIELTTLFGAPYGTFASHITSWMFITPEAREKSRAIKRVLDDEEKADRPWED